MTSMQINLPLELLTLTPGKKMTIAQAFSDDSIDFAFSSPDVKGGGMFMGNSCLYCN